MKTPAPPLQPGTTPNTFRIVGWQVFRPGFHKGQLYTAQDCSDVIRNFQALSLGESPALRVKAKLGHNAQQRIAQSLGVMNVGLVTDCRPTPDGGFAIDVDGIPETVMIPDSESGEPVAFNLKQAFDNGNYCDGSVELQWDQYPDPANPSVNLPGPVLEAVAFLGEERPGVDQLPPPAATFAADKNSPSRRVKRRVVFSEVDPMMPRDELLKALQSAGVDISDPVLLEMPDPQLAQLLKSMTSDSFAAAMKKKFASQDPMPPGTSTLPEAKTPPELGKENPVGVQFFPTPVVSSTGLKGDGPADQKTGTTPTDSANMSNFFDDGMDPSATATGDFMSYFKAFAASCEQRFGALEQAAKATQEAIKPVQMTAQFAAELNQERINARDTRATEVVDRAIKEGRVMPAAREYILSDLKRLPFARREQFTSGPNAGQTAFDVACAELLARPVSHYFTPTDDTPDVPGMSEFARRAAQNSPTGRLALKRADAK